MGHLLPGSLGNMQYMTLELCSSEVPFPTDVLQLPEYLRVMLSELCNRGALKLTHESFALYEEVVGVEDRQTL